MLTRRRLLGALLAGGWSLSGASRALASSATPVAGPASDLAAAIDALLANQAADVPFSGVALIVRGGQILLQAGYGNADVLTRAPNRPETGFQIASITKTFTATLVMQLRDEGALGLDDPAARYLPAWPHLERDGVPVTIRHLLGHTSGVPDFVTLYDLTDIADYPATLDDLLDRITGEPLLFTPGTGYAYSSSGYLYLGRIVERVTGASWETALTERILDPLDLSRTWLTPPAQPGPQATGYLRLEGLLVPVSRLGRPDLAEAAGGLTSTLADLRTWFDAFRAGRVVAPATRDEMLARGPSSYGLGIEYADLGGVPWFGHYGHTIGFRTAMFHQPELDATLILLSNRQDLDIVPLSGQIGALIAPA